MTYYSHGIRNSNNIGQLTVGALIKKPRSPLSHKEESGLVQVMVVLRFIVIRQLVSCWLGKARFKYM